jgi:hypothetical protein
MNQSLYYLCHFDARRNLTLSFRRKEKSHFVISTQGEISLCHFDERRNLTSYRRALSFRRKEKSHFISTRLVISTKGEISLHIDAPCHFDERRNLTSYRRALSYRRKEKSHLSYRRALSFRRNSNPSLLSFFKPRTHHIF